MSYFHHSQGWYNSVTMMLAAIFSFDRIPNISYSFKSKRLAVGSRNGQVAIYDLKQGRTQMVNAHSHPVTVLQFSEDGKLLATYAFADSILNVWQVRAAVCRTVLHACLPLTTYRSAVLCLVSVRHPNLPTVGLPYLVFTPVHTAHLSDWNGEPRELLLCTCLEV